MQFAVLEITVATTQAVTGFLRQLQRQHLSGMGLV